MARVTPTIRTGQRGDQCFWSSSIAAAEISAARLVGLLKCLHPGKPTEVSIFEGKGYGLSQIFSGSHPVGHQICQFQNDHFDFISLIVPGECDLLADAFHPVEAVRIHRAGIDAIGTQPQCFTVEAELFFEDGYRVFGQIPDSVNVQLMEVLLIAVSHTEKLSDRQRP